MFPIFPVVAPIILVIVGYTILSIKIISQGNEALVERWGKYHKRLDPGVNFIIPLVDTIVIEETIREKVLSIKPHQAISKDNVPLKIEVDLYWKIADLEKAFYAAEDIENMMEKLVAGTLNSVVGEMELQKLNSSRREINQVLLQELEETTVNWGIGLIRADVGEIILDQKVLEALAGQRAAELKNRAAILEAEATVASVKLLADALQDKSVSKEILQFLLTQRYVDASQQLSASPNSKIVFMDPNSLTEAMTKMLADLPDAPNGKQQGGGST